MFTITSTKITVVFTVLAIAGIALVGACVYDVDYESPKMGKHWLSVTSRTTWGGDRVLEFKLSTQKFWVFKTSRKYVEPLRTGISILFVVSCLLMVFRKYLSNKLYVTIQYVELGWTKLSRFVRVKIWNRCVLKFKTAYESLHKSSYKRM